MEYAQLVLQVSMGVSLAACTGLRAFLPFLVISILLKLGKIEVDPSFQWIGSTPALVVFGIATIVEVLGDKFPIVDHTLDSIELIVKPIAGTIIFAAVIVKMDPLLAVVLGIIAGGSISEIIHMKKATLRGGSTALTAGAANPLLSVLEDLSAAVGVAVSILVPIIAFFFVLVFLYLAYHFYKSFIKKRRKAESQKIST